MLSRSDSTRQRQQQRHQLIMEHGHMANYAWQHQRHQLIAEQQHTTHLGSCAWGLPVPSHTSHPQTEGERAEPKYSAPFGYYQPYLPPSLLPYSHHRLSKAPQLSSLPFTPMLPHSSPPHYNHYHHHHHCQPTPVIKERARAVGDPVQSNPAAEAAEAGLPNGSCPQEDKLPSKGEKKI